MTDPKLKELRDQLAKSQYIKETYSHDDSDKESYIKHFTSLGHDAELAAQEYDKKKSEELIIQDCSSNKINYEQLIMPLLPKSWQNAIDGARKCSNAPFEMLLATTLGFTNSCVHAHFDIEAYWDEEDRHPTSLFIIVISPPASSKSTVMKLFQEPIYNYIKTDTLDYKNKREIANTIAEKRYAKDLKAYEEDQLDDNPIGVLPPAQPKLQRKPFKLHSNVTLPKLGLNLNPTTHTSFITTEGACMFGSHAFKKAEESNETTSSLCLFWDGAPYNKETKGDEEVHIEDRRLNMLVCIQPALAGLIFDKGYEGVGFVGRLLTVSTPAFLKPAPNRKDSAHRMQMKKYKNQIIEFNDVLSRIMNLKIKVVSSDEPLRLSPSLIKYSQECIDYIDDTITLWTQSEITNNAAVGAQANRMTEEWARIAATLEVYDFVETTDSLYLESNRECLTISKKYAECAKLILEMFFDQKKDLELPSLASYDNANLKASEELKNWMIRKNKKEIKMREIQTSGPKSCRKNLEILAKIIQEGVVGGWWVFQNNQITML